MTRPYASYRGVRRNDCSHIAKSKKLVPADDVREYRGQWNCYPEISHVREGRKPSFYKLR